MFWKQIVQYIQVITTKSFDILLLSTLLRARPNTPVSTAQYLNIILKQEITLSQLPKNCQETSMTWSIWLPGWLNRDGLAWQIGKDRTVIDGLENDPSVNAPFSVLSDIKYKKLIRSHQTGYQPPSRW